MFFEQNLFKMRQNSVDIKEVEIWRTAYEIVYLELQMNPMISSFLQFVSHVKKSTDDQKWLEKSGNFCNTLAHENSRQMHVTCRHIRIIVWSVVPITAMYILAVFNMQINSHLVFTCQNPIWKIFTFKYPTLRWHNIFPFTLYGTI